MTDETATSQSQEAPEVAPQTAVTATPAEDRDEPRDDNARAAAANAQAEGVETEENADGEQVAVEEFELDVAGTKHKFPKGTPIEEALEKVQAYSKGLEAELTRKSQKLSNDSKFAEEQIKVAQRLQSLKGEQMAVYAEGVAVSNEIERLNKIDMNALWQSDPDQARRVSDALVQYRHRYEQIHSDLAQYGETLNQAERQFVEVRAKEGEQVVAKAIKGWSPQVESELIDYAVKQGVAPEVAKGWRTAPQTTLAFWKAMQFDKLQAKAQAATKTPTPPPPPAPVTSIRGGKGTGTASPDLEKMSMEDYVRHMEKREGRRSR